VVNDGRVLVVGAGINGLLTAYEVGKAIGFENVTIADQFPDPRSLPQFTHNGGATYSGGDARHVSITESSMMASSRRATLIGQPVEQGGWLGTNQPHADEFQASFVQAGNDPELLRREDERIFGLNREGMERWFALADELPGIVRPITDDRTLTIFCSSDELLRSEFESERELDPGRVRLLHDAGAGYGAVQDVLSRTGSGGAFEVAGAAYQGKTLCVALIDELSTRGVQFKWEHRIGNAFRRLPGYSSADKSFYYDAQRSGLRAYRGVAVCTGSSLPGYELAHEHTPKSVAGLWIILPNPGISKPFKWIGVGEADPEPVNFVNVTPHGDLLYVSGGYTYVGDASVEDAATLVKPVFTQFFDQVKQWLALPHAARLHDYQRAVCLRPVFPDSGAHITAIDSWFGNVVVNRGHGAGGFTEAPAAAVLVVNALGLASPSRIVESGGRNAGIGV
jgi:glycine/D-amino acid oxidase-like deaminating enzyme